MKTTESHAVGRMLNITWLRASFSFFLFWTQKFVVLEAHMLISSVTLKTPCDGGAKLTFLCSLYLVD